MKIVAVLLAVLCALASARPPSRFRHSDKFYELVCGNPRRAALVPRHCEGAPKRRGPKKFPIVQHHLCFEKGESCYFEEDCCDGLKCSSKDYKEGKCFKPCKKFEEECHDDHDCCNPHHECKDKKFTVTDCYYDKKHKKICKDKVFKKKVCLDKPCVKEHGDCSGGKKCCKGECKKFTKCDVCPKYAKKCHPKCYDEYKCVIPPPPPPPKKHHW